MPDRKTPTDAGSDTPDTAGRLDMETRRRRLAIRCWRRGTKEMDLILGRFADCRLAELDPEIMTSLESILDENDWDIYYWVTGARPAPLEHVGIVAELAAFHRTS